MKIEIHEHNGIRIAEVIAEEMLIRNIQDGLQLLVDLYYQDFGKIVIYKKNITSDFFDLKNGLAGEILQKFSNYRVQLVIVGDFSAYTGKSIRDFIHESNKNQQVNFVGDLEEAILRLSRT
jgi:hypothetical protein